MMKTTKKSLIASGLSLLTCAALLIGTTFAWFTDSVSNTGNRIEAGTLDVDLLMDKDGAGSGGYESIADGEGDIFSEKTGNGILWEPGKTEIVYLAVQNKGSLALKYNLLLDVTDGNPGLVGALEYAVLDGKQASDLTDVTTWEEVLAVEGVQTGDIAEGRTTAAPNGMLDEIALTSEKNETDYFALAVYMKEDAGNEYQNGSVTIDVTLVATQATAEEDGFDNPNYDENAPYPTLVSDSEGLTSAAAEGGVIKITDTIALSEDLTFAKDTVIDLNGQTLTVNGALKAPVGTTLTIEGNGTINGTLYADKTGMKGGTIIVNAGEDFEVVAPESSGRAVYGAMGSNIQINGGTYTGSQDKTNVGQGVIEMMGSSTLDIRNAVINVETKSVMNVSGIQSNASSNYLENVTVNAKYSRAVYFNNQYGKAIVRGGTFITNQESDGFVSATIQYSGTLDISDAQITHIGNGILFQRSYPQPTEVEGLTYENCTFTKVGNLNYKEIDFK